MALAQIQQVSFTREAPHTPTTRDNRIPSTRIEEVTEAHILQIVSAEEDSEPDDEDLFDFFQVYATEKKCETWRSKLPELQSSTSPSANTAPSPSALAASHAPGTAPAVSLTHAAAAPPAPTTPPTQTRTAPQYRYQSTAEDQRLISELESWFIEGKLTPAHILAASPIIQKGLVKKLRVRRVETSSYEEATDIALTDTTHQSAQPTSPREPAYSLPLREIDIQIGGKIVEAGVIDPGSQIIVMRVDLAREVGATINAKHQLHMEGANGATNWTLECAEYLPMSAGNISFVVHAHVVERAPFRLLLGRPFQHALLCRIEDLPSGDVEVSVRDPADPFRRITIPSRPRKVQVASVGILALACQPPSLSQLPSLSLSPSQSSLTSPSWPMSKSSSPLLSASQLSGDTTSVQAYKKVAKKVRPVPASLPERFPLHPPHPFRPSSHLVTTLCSPTRLHSWNSAHLRTPGRARAGSRQLSLAGGAEALVPGP